MLINFINYVIVLFVKYLLSLLIFFIPNTSFAEDWILIKKDFECFQERGRSCYIFFADDTDNETYLSYINIKRHAFEEFKLSLFVDYLSSDEYEIFINDENKFPRKNESGQKSQKVVAVEGGRTAVKDSPTL